MQDAALCSPPGKGGAPSTTNQNFRKYPVSTTRAPTSKYSLRSQAGAPSTTNHKIKNQAGCAPRASTSTVLRNQAWTIHRSEAARNRANLSRSKSRNQAGSIFRWIIFVLFCISEHFPDVSCLNRASTSRCKVKTGSTFRAHRCRFKHNNQAGSAPRFFTFRCKLWN